MQTKSIAPPAPDQTITSSRLTDWMRRHPIVSFFVMAYAFSWLSVIPFVLSEWGLLAGDWRLAFALKPFVGPTLAAYLMTRLLDGREGLLRQRRKIVQWREGWQWYLFILVVFPAFFFLGLALFPGVLASFTGLPRGFLVSYAVYFVTIFFFGGPLGEEIGWRGFALPRLQDRYGALKATLLLGVMWTFWHLPDFLTSAQHGGPAAGLRPFYANLPIFFLLIMSISVVFTWVYNHTHGSVFMAILLHASLNALGYFVALFPVPVVQETDLPMAVGWAVLAALILVFTRGRLGDSQPRP